MALAVPLVVRANVRVNRPAEVIALAGPVERVVRPHMVRSKSLNLLAPGNVGFTVGLGFTWQSVVQKTLNDCANLLACDL